MNDKTSLLETLHEATHRLPGVPDHVDQPAGHQGTARDAHSSRTERHAHHRTRNHSRATPPRVLVAWQRRIAGLFGQALD